MSHLGQIKKKWNWESSAIRCGNCSKFKPARTYLMNSLPKTSVSHCVLGGFTTKPQSVCDKWVDVETNKPCINEKH